MAGEQQQYRDPRGLTRWLSWLLIATALMYLLFGAALVSHMRFLVKVHDHAFTSATEALDAARENDVQQDYIASALTLAFVSTVILFVVWTHRMNANIHALHAPNLRFTPAWAAGWYFVPIANLWKPYQVLSEIWRASMDLTGWQAKPAKGLLRWWWFWWLAACTAGTINLRFTSTTNEVAPQILMTLLDIVQAGIWFISLSVALRMVRRLGALQAQAADRSLSAVFA